MKGANENPYHNKVMKHTSKKVLFHSLERNTTDALLSKPCKGHFMVTQLASTLHS